MISAALGVPPVTRDDAQRAARRELSKHIYHRYDDPLAVRVLRAVLDWLDRVYDATARHAPGGGAGALAFVLILVVLVLAARWRLGPIRFAARVDRPLLDEHRLTAAEHRASARRAADEQRWQEAVVEGMRAIAGELEERGLLDRGPGRTADEVADQAARALPESAPAFRAAAVTFDAVVYGGRVAGLEEWRRVRAADEAVRVRRSVVATGHP